ncbi:gephyrin-like molybdotransferase receptor GlpR [Nocardia sp. NPDC057353]|uniref:divisome protein SepX/GlpR n=1 Tax=Nocardia sp. NPDC057353 TaxID=3346104 RepID=UPI003638EF10
MPNSILWIGLVVLWVFVIFPMLANRHPRIRRTTDAALATRVLYRGGSKRRRKNGRHDSDPDYRPTRRTRRLPQSDDAEDRMTTSADEPVTDDEDTVTDPRDPEDGPADTVAAETAGASTADGPAGAAVDLDDRADDDFDDDLTDDDLTDDDLTEGDRAEDDRVDSDLAEDDFDDEDRGTEAAEYVDEPYEDDAEYEDEDASAPAPAADSRVSARIPPAPAKTPARLDDDGYADGDTGSEGERDAEKPAERTDDDFVPTRRGRGGYDPEADAIARAARYTFRQRAVLGLLLAGLLCGGLGLAVAPALWWGTGLSLAVLVAYLAYLRKQVRMEEEIRRRRSARLARGRSAAEAEEAEVEPAAPRRERRAAVGMDRDTARLLRRRSVLLEPDDEAPDFEQLETFDPAAARALRNRTADMRRAVGE